MPYIEHKYKEKFSQLLNLYPSSPGELNYVITTICQNYLLGRGVNYAEINSVIGVLECSKLEAYRRIATPYEEEKIELNGDVMVFDKWNKDVQSQAASELPLA